MLLIFLVKVMYFIFTDENNITDICDGSNKIICKTGVCNIDKNFCMLIRLPMVKLDNKLDIFTNQYVYRKYPYIRFALSHTDGQTMQGFNGTNIYNKIILSDRYYLYDPKTIKKFNLEVNELYITHACAFGDIRFLEWWKHSGLELKYSNNALDTASNNGHINVLTWWIKSGLPLKYSNNALDNIPEYNSVDALTWWLKSNLPLKYSNYALDWASYSGRVDVLTWWFNSGLPLKYTVDSINFALWNGHINVLEWWKNSRLELKYNADTLTFASFNGQVDVLEWCENNIEPLFNHP